MATTPAPPAEGAPAGAEKPDELKRVTSMEDVLRICKQPFTPDAVRWKLQTNPKDGDPSKSGVAVGYIDARLVAARLNAIPGLLWSESYKANPVGGIHSLVCRLRLVVVDDKGNELEVIHEDVGTSTDVAKDMGMKALYSDAFKRAGVKLGIGQSLYAFPSQWVKGSDMRTYGPQDKLKFALTDANEATLKRAYNAWLTSTGERLFGKPLDHGDIEGSAGDVEAGETRSAATPEPAAAAAMYGPALDGPAQERALAAMALLLDVGDGPDDEGAGVLVQTIMDDVAKSSGANAYFPKIVGRALLHAGAQVKAAVAAKDAAPEPPPVEPGADPGGDFAAGFRKSDQGGADGSA